MEHNSVVHNSVEHYSTEHDPAGHDPTKQYMELDEKVCRELIRTAVGMLEYSYSPYSGFRVGAALLCSDGKIYTGCNIENAAFTPGLCAERTAIYKAVSEGNRSFRAICIVGGKNGELKEFAPPCGTCRQVMMEFCDPDKFEIILATDEEHYERFTLREMLPMGFGPGSLG